MPDDLIIIGAGGTSRNIAAMVEEINEREPAWNLLGFLDDDPHKTGLELLGYPVLGTTGAVSHYPEARFVIGIAHYRRREIRRTVAARLGLPPERFATLIHPSVSFKRHVKIGRGTVILPGSVIGAGVVIGNHVIVSDLVHTGHDTIIEACATVAAGSCISGGVRIGQCAYLGAGSVVIDGIEIGEGSLVGAGAVVVHNVAAGAVVAGNPARGLQRGDRAVR